MGLQPAVFNRGYVRPWPTDDTARESVLEQ
jgi:hypothetical protein